jgi:signal transduction histidine kinase
MQAHGGSIAVERQAGRGTSFVLTFPKAAFAKSA